MRRTHRIASLSGLAVIAAALVVPTAAADPAQDERRTAVAPTSGPDAGGRGAATATTADPIDRADVVRRAAAAPAVADPIVMPTSYPTQPQLRQYRDNPNDGAEAAELLTHPDLAPQLQEWMAASDRISTQVIGQSTEGRDLYLVTVTAPERAEDTAQQTAWREKIKNDPEAAAADTALLGQYKTPVWISANIHGNEWEGTDAVMQYIDWLVSSPQAEVGSILRNNRLYFSLSLNPDGRTNTTRATALGLDPNRDMITNTTAEATSFVRTAQAIQPIYNADLHGYTAVLQMEPTGPPHGSNYEYDVYLPHNYALALKVERDVVAADIPGNTYYNVVTGAVSPTNTGPDTAHIKIPYRDTPSGWDDFPPIFTAQYAAFFGAATSTVELPLRRNGANGRQSPANGVINTAVALETVTSLVEYLDTPLNAREMLQNQIEVFRRGVAGEAKTNVTTENIAGIPGPAEWKPLWDVADDQDAITVPRAYVIPVGEDQRSASDANALVEQLLFNDIEVGRLTADATVGETTYAAGSYVVDMHQPLRGLANALLDLGEDISAKVPTMYDISAWSYSYLWGATVDKVGLTTDADPVGPTEPVTAPTPNASLPGAGYLTFDVAGVADVQALNALLEDEVAVSMLEDGSAVVAPEDRDAVAAVSEEFDLAVSEATAEDVAALDDEATKGLTDLQIAYTGTQDDRLALTQLGFDDLTLVNATVVNATPGVLDDVDVLWIGSALTLAEGSPGRAAVSAFVADGGSIVGRTANAFNVASTYGLVSGTAVTGNTSGNGIVDVDTPEGSLLAPYAQDAAFIYPAAWFTGLGEGTTVEQSYGADPLLAGHWLPSGAGTNGPNDAAGQASVISGESASGARAVVFGTSVFFRTHPKGGMSQAARALYWAGPSGSEVQAPTSTTVALSASTPVTYPGDVTFEAVVSADETVEGTPTGTVEILDDTESVVGSADLVSGTATVTVSGLRPGTSAYTARYTPDAPAFDAASSGSVDVRVAKAMPTTRLSVKKLAGGRFEATIRFVVPGLPSRGVVTLNDFGKQLRVVRFTGTGPKKVTLTLSKGKHGLRAVSSGSDTLAVSRSPRVDVRVR